MSVTRARRSDDEVLAESGSEIQTGIQTDTSPGDIFESELAVRLEHIKTRTYRADAPEYRPLSASDWRLLFVVAVVVPVLLTLLAFVTW